MSYRFLTESSGSLTSAYIIKNIQMANHICIASDINQNCAAETLANEFIVMPEYKAHSFWEKINNLLNKHNIDIVIPSFDETLLGWSEKKDIFHDKNISVIISEPSSIEVCQDKWLTYNFFSDNGVPTAKSSLEQKFTLVKPRFGRGGKGVDISGEKINMKGMISQEYLEGDEFTVDVFCDQNGEPVYIIPRRRKVVIDGKSTISTTEYNDQIEGLVKYICTKLKFIGPINFQCFLTLSNEIKFIEINPRIAGGMALGMAASENWINLIISNIIKGIKCNPKDIKYGLEMRRYYAETFISTN
jgi:carbamoyl-phosphate synthase large subunit